MEASQSLASRRFRLIQAKKGSTTQRLGGEADLIGLAPDDFDGDGCSGSDSVAGIAAIGEEPFDKGEGPPRGAPQPPGAIAILNASMMGFEPETAAIAIDEPVAFPARDLLASVIPARTAAFRRLDALTIDDRGARRCFPADGLAVLHHEQMVDRFEASSVAQQSQPAVDRAPGRQVGWQQPPRATRPHPVEDPVDDLAHRP
jgi:hypothetical protein